ncbi:hypothetical protein BDZ45DRAFT_708165 [Acephala macrosclerotiorum]|nr:hypothetical protein BDZ45DRAFT_708165 [Acephala macrosclerotiorum]
MSSSNNRRTQIDILALVEIKSLIKVTKCIVFNTSSKTRVRSLTNKLNTTIGIEKTQSKIVKFATNNSFQLRTAFIKVVIRKASLIKLVHIKAFSIQAIAKTLHIFQQFQYRNLVLVFEVFTTNNSLYIVLEYMPISFERIVRSPAYSDERQLATILEQMNCHKYCYVISQFKNESRNIKTKTFLLITIELMQKYVKKDRTIDINNLNRWSLNSNAVKFLFVIILIAFTTKLFEYSLLVRL